ncbi:MAG TPA: nucleotidyltransferase domain-containing protein [Afifellaceae bacterium]|nr:nucleotidyltransferase domain-containing protein [Afifellaceae bacterium]
MTAAGKTLTVDREKVLAALRAKRAEIEERYGLRMVGIVGSVARGEAGAESDVDVMVDIIRTPSLFKISGAEHDVEDAIGLGLRVEFVLREDLRPGMRARMERDFVPL